MLYLQGKRAKGIEKELVGKGVTCGGQFKGKISHSVGITQALYSTHLFRPVECILEGGKVAEIDISYQEFYLCFTHFLTAYPGAEFRNENVT